MYAEARKQLLRAAERIEAGQNFYKALDEEMAAPAWRLVTFEVTGRDMFFTDMERDHVVLFLYFVGHSDLEA